MKVLVINTGSSSVKYRLFDMAQSRLLAAGIVERIGEPMGKLVQRTYGTDGTEERLEEEGNYANHRASLERVGAALQQSGVLQSFQELSAIGHRVVHGGEAFQAPTLVTSDVLDKVREMIPLAPLHNPPNLVGIEVALQFAPGVPQVAVFDTAFHQTMPAYAYRYAIPEEAYRKHQVRRYGFHGTSHSYVSGKVAELMGRPVAGLRVITMHLGNGCSAAAVLGGRSMDTSMGLTPLEGLVMGTRCGNLDPSIPAYLAERLDCSPREVDSLLNKESGLKGLVGVGDMREVHRLSLQGDERALLALDLFCYRIRKYVGAYLAVLGGADAVVFTGGIGENNDWLRAKALAGLENLGIAVDPARNGGLRSEGAFHVAGSPVELWVVPTDEELEIAQQAVACIDGRRS